MATIIGVAVGRYPVLRMNRATIAMTGATALMVRAGADDLRLDSLARLAIGAAALFIDSNGRSVQPVRVHQRGHGTGRLSGL